MQLEINFNTEMNWQLEMLQCADCFYSILIWMQILAEPNN